MDIARAAFRIKDLRTELLKLFLKEISKECCEIISSKNPSLLRKNSASDMQQLSLQKVCDELKARSPLLYSVMMTAAIPARKQKHSLGSENWLPSVAVAGSVLLKQRSRNVNAVQLLVTTLIKYTGFHAMSHFLSSLRIGVSPSYYNKKSDEFGQLFNNVMIQQKQEDEAVLKSCGPSVLQSQPSVPSQNEDAGSTQQTIQSSAPTQNDDASSTLQSIQSSTQIQNEDTSSTLHTIQSSTPIQNEDASSTLQSIQSSAPIQNKDASSTLQSIQSSAPIQNEDAGSTLQSIQSSAPIQNEDARSTLQSIQSSTPIQNEDASSTLHAIQSSNLTENQGSSSTLQCNQTSGPTQNGDASSIGQSIPSSSQTKKTGCNKTFKHDGKHRRNHERTAHGLIIEDPPGSEVPSLSSSEESDDMFNYQCNLMDHGLLYMNFIDAVAEGDGDRIIRCWKFLLLHFYSDSGSTKYAVEALYLQLQQQALLSPRQAYRQRWNRGVNNHSGSGKNVPLDLEVEHDNNAIKEGIRKLGPNLTHGSVSRCARMLPVARETVHNVAKECNLMRRSGKHFVKTTRNDLTKLVNLLVQEDALTETPGRCYKHFKKFSRSPLRNLRMGKLCQWINKHKHELQIGRRAR